MAVTSFGGVGTGASLFTYIPPAPTVTAIAPTSGTTLGGTAVTITGTNLTGATAVTIGGAAATSVVVVNATTITAVTPAGTAGTASVLVTTPGGTNAANTLYTFVAPPTVTSVTANSGPLSGTSVNITGTNFTGATAVTFGGTAATSFVVANSTSIIATAPAHAAGTVDVAVTTPGGTGIGTGLFTYAAAPTVTSVSPNSGPTTGGTNVTITGTNFFGSVVAQASVLGSAAPLTNVTVVNSTTITATMPARSAGMANVIVFAAGGSGTGSGLFTYYAAPTVTAISPTSGTTLGGTAVTITGTNLTGATAVTIGGNAATSVVVVNATTITAVTPAGTAGTASVLVTTPGGTNAPNTLYTYVSSTLTVTKVGSGTGTVTSSPAGINCGATCAASFSNGTSVILTASPDPGSTFAGWTGACSGTSTCNVVMNVDKSVVANFAAVAPTVTSISPTSGTTLGGTAVTITGTNLTGATAVTIGGAAATSVVVVNATTITAVTPAGTAGTASVLVTTPGGTNAPNTLYTYVTPAPTVTAIAPTSGTTLGGTAVTITGTNLTGATAVTIGGAAATSVVVVNSTTITAVTPVHAAGVVDVVVTTPGGPGTGTGLYTYIAAPSTTAVASSVNPSQMNQPVTLTATVAPSVATGTVTFKDGATVLCNAVPIVSGVATCSASFTTAGAHALTAVYSGNASYATSTGALTQSVDDTRARTVEAIGKFIGARNNQILSNGPDGARQIDRLNEAGGGPSSGSGSGFAATGAGFAPGGAALAMSSSRLGSGPDAGDISQMRLGGRRETPLADTIAGLGGMAGGAAHDGNPFPGPRGSFGGSGSGVFGYGGPGGLGIGGTQSPLAGLLGLGSPSDSAGTGGGAVQMNGMRMSGNVEGAMRLGFATSLRDMSRAATDADARKMTEAGLGMSGGPGVARAARPNPFDIWVEAKFSSFRDGRSSPGLDGHFGIVSIGADYVLNRSLLVGTFVQIDSMQQRSSTQATDVRGHGWMAGPYATLRLSENVFWQARGAWGRSSNLVSPFLTYTDKFETERWLVSTTLAGRWSNGAWSFRPSASVSYMQDAAVAYTDTFGTSIPSVKSSLGQAKAGPEIGYRLDLGHTVIEPHAGVQVIWNFAHETVAAGLGPVGDDNAGPAGVRGRAEIGVRATTSGGIGLDVSGSYDGIGAGGYSAMTGRAMIRVPLN